MPIRRLPPGAEYDPNRLLDAIIHRLRLKNDAALARSLEVAPAVISKLRHGSVPIGATLLLRMHDVSGLGVNELRALMIKEEAALAEA